MRTIDMTSIVNIKKPIMRITQTRKLIVVIIVLISTMRVYNSNGDIAHRRITYSYYIFFSYIWNSVRISFFSFSVINYIDA